MPISLYDITVSRYVQVLRAVDGILARGLSHCQENCIDPESIVESRLHVDMLPFRFQIQSVVYFTVGAVDAVRAGAVTLPGKRPAHTYVQLQEIVDDAYRTLRSVSPEEINSHEGKEVRFDLGDSISVFTVTGFAMSFIMPNLHFHATTAYDLLRLRGVPLGKIDYLGELDARSESSHFRELS